MTEPALRDPNTIIVLTLKATDGRRADHDAYFSTERFAGASDDERIILEEQ